MRNFMNWIKIGAINIIVLIFAIFIIEIISGSVYHDHRHHNAKGNKILASEIWEIIQKNSN